MHHKHIPHILIGLPILIWTSYFLTFPTYGESEQQESPGVVTTDTDPLPVVDSPGVVDPVAQVTHQEIQGPRYTIRVGLDGKRKNIPKITGESTDARAKQWLDTSGIGNTLDTWKRLGEKYKLDYALPLCIGWADSHNGLALKSKNNIGNIGNNDRGDTKEFETLEAGIEAIFWSLAHGKYMKGHEIIGTLSQEGRTRIGLPSCTEEKNHQKKCYATSKAVWSTNVTNCLSVIHDKQIDEKYFFGKMDLPY